MEIKINIPDNCELIQKGDTYIIVEKQKLLPKTWEDFCKNYSIEKEEYYIDKLSTICSIPKASMRCWSSDKNLFSTKEDAEAFLALTQLRRLRNAWVGDWKPSEGHYSVYISGNSIAVNKYYAMRDTLSFPSSNMAEEFADCFKDLILKAKILL